MKNYDSLLQELRETINQQFIPGDRKLTLNNFEEYINKLNNTIIFQKLNLITNESSEDSEFLLSFFGTKDLKECENKLFKIKSLLKEIKDTDSLKQIADFDFQISLLKKLKNKEASPQRNDEIRWYRSLVGGLNNHLELLKNPQENEDFANSLVAPFFKNHDLKYCEEKIEELNKVLGEFGKYEGYIF